MKAMEVELEKSVRYSLLVSAQASLILGLEICRLKKKVRFITLFIVFGISHLLGQQTSIIDSLMARVDSSSDADQKANVLNKLAFHLHVINPEQGLQFAKEALALDVHTDSIKFYTRNSMAANYWALGNYPQAILAFKEAKVFAEKSEKLRLLAMVEGNLGMIYSEINEYESAEKHLKKAMHLDSIAENQQGTFLHKYNLALMYSNIKKEDKAVLLFREVLEKAMELKDTSSMGMIYAQLAINLVAMGEVEQAIEYLLHYALPICRLNKDNYYFAAVTYYHSGFAFFQKYLYKKETAPHMTHKYANLLNQAEAYLDTALLINEKLGNILIMAQVKQIQAQLMKERGNWEKAYHYTIEFVHLQDSIFGLEKKSEIARIETKQEMDLLRLNKQAALEKAEKERVEKRALAGFLLLGSVASVGLLFLYRNTLKANQRLDREKKKSEHLLLNILPLEVAQELKTDGHSPARQYDLVTVLFTDFVGFTQKSEEMSPHALVTELDICFRAFDAIIEKYGLEKIKTIGDAYLAVAGLPKYHPDHAALACRAAIEIQSFIQNRLKEGGPFNIRIGIHSGPVVAGIVGVKKYAYDIWGDTVNTAARMEQNAEIGMINISSQTLALLPDTFQYIERGKIHAKNKGALNMYYLECEHFT